MCIRRTRSPPHHHRTCSYHILLCRRVFPKVPLPLLLLLTLPLRYAHIHIHEYIYIYVQPSRNSYTSICIRKHLESLLALRNAYIYVRRHVFLHINEYTPVRSPESLTKCQPCADFAHEITSPFYKQYSDNNYNSIC